MRLATGIAALGFLAMVFALFYGFTQGGGFAEVRDLMGSPWFVVSLVDVYVGFALFAIWIALRERAIPACAWIVALMLLGNLVACGYALIAIRTSRGDPQRLAWGSRHQT